MAEANAHSPSANFPIAVVIPACGTQQAQAQHLTRFFGTKPRPLWLQSHKCHWPFTVKSLASFLFRVDPTWSHSSACFRHVPYRKPGSRSSCDWFHPAARFFNVNCHKSEYCSTKALRRPNPHSLVSKMKLYFFSCKGNTEIIPLMLMKYQHN